MKIIILLSLVLSALKSSSQTYYAKYQVSSTNGFVEKIGIPGELKAIYHVWANNDYIEVIGTDPEIKILATSQLKEHSSNERVIMSYKDSLCYFVNEKKYVKIKYYPAEVLKKNGTNEVILISRQKATITLASYLPICLTPGIFLNSTITNLGGVKSFNSSNTKITLIGKYKIVNKKMNYYRYFINVDKTKITEDLSFF